MNPKLKLTAYAVLVILCVWFGWGFYSNYSASTTIPADNGATTTTEPETTSTNAPTNTIALTNSPAAANTNETASDSNATAPDANTAATTGTNVAVTPDTNAPPVQPKASAPAPQVAKATAPAPDIGARRSAMMSYLAAMVGAFIGLGLLIAMDATQFLGTRAVDFLFNDAGEGQRDPEYELAEAEWAKGKFLDAIQMLRDFLKKNPREIYAAIRIAEIYEKDLRNYLAAALEYEEVLKHKLPAERWGWAAVHLCNLYSKLNQSDKALALLHRIADEYPKTGAAKKARARLGIAEPEPEAVEEAPAEAEPESTGENMVITMEEHPPELEPRAEAPAPPPPPASSAPPKPSLPSGFRPKK